jgi:hypothetical protein
VLVEAVPNWFEDFIVAAKIPDPFASGLDHWRSFKNVAVFSPYKATGEDLLRLLQASSRAGLLVHFSGRSSYDPKTFQIAIYRPQDAADFHESEEAEKILELED